MLCYGSPCKRTQGLTIFLPLKDCFVFISISISHLRKCIFFLNGYILKAVKTGSSCKHFAFSDFTSFPGLVRWWRSSFLCLFVLLTRTMGHIPPGFQGASVCEGSVAGFCLTVSCRSLLFITNQAPWLLKRCTFSIATVNNDFYASNVC